MSDGIGCKCFASYQGECACDADWTPQEVYDLRAKVDYYSKLSLDNSLSCSEKIVEINSLKEQVKELQSHLFTQSIEIAHNDITLESYAHKVTELQAHVNQLREALEDIAKHTPENFWQNKASQQALSKTVPQCLIENDNALIERIALALENAEGEFKTLPEYVSLVRALKATS